jgi:gamma-Secretase-activating protein C-term
VQRFPKAADRGICQAIAKEYANVRGLLVEELYQALLQSVPPLHSDSSDVSERIRFRHHQNLFCALEMLECPAPPGFWAQFVRSGVGAVHSRDIFVQHVKRGVFVVDPRVVEATCVGNEQSGGAFERAKRLRESMSSADMWFKQELLATVGHASLRHRLMHALPEHRLYLLHYALDNLPDVLSAAAAGQLHAKRARLAVEKREAQQRERDLADVVIDVSDLEDGRSADEVSASSEEQPSPAATTVPPGLAQNISRVWRDLLHIGDDGGFFDMEVANDSPFIPLSVFLSALPFPVDRGEGEGSIGPAAMKAAQIAAAVFDAPIVHFVVQQAQHNFEKQFLLPFTPENAKAYAAEYAKVTSELASAVTDVGVPGPGRSLGSGAHGDNASLPALRSSVYLGDDDVSSSDGSVSMATAHSKMNRTPSISSLQSEDPLPRPDDSFVTVDLDAVEITDGEHFTLV